MNNNESETTNTTEPTLDELLADIKPGFWQTITLESKNYTRETDVDGNKKLTAEIHYISGTNDEVWLKRSNLKFEEGKRIWNIIKDTPGKQYRVRIVNTDRKRQDDPSKFYKEWAEIVPLDNPANSTPVADMEVDQ